MIKYSKRSGGDALIFISLGFLLIDGLLLNLIKRLAVKYFSEAKVKEILVLNNDCLKAANNY
ncbi:hypothetical protein XA3_15840 [Xylocopilactobacillus apicola]|uniref:Flp pilus-assembly TadG-like N-terminal domain-containing protein n=1 Tax=Xylocopilactobacillus apicola TaxID=2932184 RepID=A0AAU9D6H2_9LACO|nr:hypothetical protein XA3_15840 [Xylocopilactobacillus apicola]